MAYDFYVKQVFCIDDHCFEGYHNPDYDWNGWEAPKFTKEVHEEIYKHFQVPLEEQCEISTEIIINGQKLTVYCDNDNWTWKVKTLKKSIAQYVSEYLENTVWNNHTIENEYDLLSIKHDTAFPIADTILSENFSLDKNSEKYEKIEMHYFCEIMDYIQDYQFVENTLKPNTK